ncbi:unnamed protein product [Effrenium voratum]|uniref:Uncharacterized protein n=1 Tax=Effrenium voratum TaxID=2562239 RepID=A0AA36MYH5_9DINO|nr:unnamed protein product [Effrenium voratum]
MVHMPEPPVLGALTMYPSVPVKGTFVHFHQASNHFDAPEMEELQRGQTAPPGTCRHCEPDTDDEEEVTSGSPGSSEVAELVSFPQLEAPVMEELCRYTTHDRFEKPFESDDEEGVHREFYAAQEDPAAQFYPGILPHPEGSWGMALEEMQPEMSGTVTSYGMHPFVFVPIAHTGQAPMEPSEWMGMMPMTQMMPMHDMSQMMPEPAGNDLAESVAGHQQDTAGTDYLKSILLLKEPLQREVTHGFWSKVGELPHQPQKIGRSQDMRMISWVADSQKLNDKTKVLVSPEFKIEGPHGKMLSFKAVMYPQDKTSFRQAGGQGYVQLKCESDTHDLKHCSLTFRLGISNGLVGQHALREGPRPPVTWDFKKSLVCDDPEVKKNWDFTSVVDSKSRTFAVCIEIVKMHVC